MFSVDNMRHLANTFKDELLETEDATEIPELELSVQESFGLIDTDR